MRKIFYKQKGQLTIFFGIILLLIITCMAFIINVGMFVKAKINLQNAVDSAAWSGAAVQARQLSDIAYVNWELRNVYKEWLFKYYVLGMLSLPKTSLNYLSGNSNIIRTDFRLSTGISLTRATGDLYNLPSTCIYFAGASHNRCKIYTFPGLPRFSKLGLTGIDDVMDKFQTTLVKESADECSKMAILNYKVQLWWAYGTKLKDNAYDATIPLLASDRPGAWPKAIELALRIRNMEKIVNLPPRKLPICNKTGGGCTNVRMFYQQPGAFPIYERPVKAFWTGYRNLENNNQYDLKGSFKLTELPPRSIPPVNERNLNEILNPAGVTKYYLDLRLHLLNFGAFYTLFTAKTSKLHFGGGGADANVDAEGSCGATKMALPVPAYPFNFVRNPEVLTYYAVKGEGEFNGLFNPFTKPTKMEAYAAAKPYGGRIGPMLFTQNTSENKVSARTVYNRSYPYISGLMFSPPPQDKQTKHMLKDILSP